jgi:hypothetical protein
MRKVILALLFLCGFSPLAHAATSIVFTWSDTSNASTPACTTTVTTSCLTTYTLTDTTTGTVITSTIPSATLTFTYTPTGGIPFGFNHTFSLTISGVTATGTTVVSAPATTTITENVLNAPTGFSAVTQ